MDANSTNFSNSTTEIDFKTLSQIIDYTSYFFYTSIFLFGITGNSVVIYVLLSPICCGSKSNRDHFGYNAAPTSHYYNSPVVRKKSSFKNKPIGTLKRSKAFNNNEEITANDRNVIFCEQQDTHRSIHNASPFNGNSSFTHHTRISSKKLRFYVVNFFKEKLNVTNFYLFNLAFTDFMYLTTIPFLICTIYWKSWVFGRFFCKAFMSTIYICQCSSVFILVVLSIDRYLSVKYPHKVSSFRNTEISRIVIFITWFLAFLFVIPVTLFTSIISADQDFSSNSTEIENRIIFCVTDWPPTWNFTENSTNAFKVFTEYVTPLYAYLIYTFSVNYLIPVGIIVILYVNILRKLHRKSKIKKSKTKTKSHRKITRMVLCIVICYLICWTPYWSLQIFNYFWQHVNKAKNSEVIILMVHFVQIIAYLSSALNPFIYSYMSEAFRTNLKNEWRNGFCCKKEKESKTSICQKNKTDSKRNTSIQSERTRSRPKLLSSYFVNNKNKLSQIEGSGVDTESIKSNEIEPNKFDVPYSPENVITKINTEEPEYKHQLTAILTESEANSSTKTNLLNRNNKPNKSSLKKTETRVPTKIDNKNPNNQIKTYIYKTKSNFAFAINFHSLSAKKHLIIGNKRHKLRAINGVDQQFKRERHKVKFFKFDSVKSTTSSEADETELHTVVLKRV